MIQRGQLLQMESCIGKKNFAHLQRKVDALLSVTSRSLFPCPLVHPSVSGTIILINDFMETTCRYCRNGSGCRHTIQGTPPKRRYIQRALYSGPRFFR